MIRIVALFLVLTSCSAPSGAEVPSQESLGLKVKSLADNLVKPDKKALEALVHPKLTYGHSGGDIENKSEFINALYGETDILKWEMKGLRKEFVGNTAWVRHDLDGKVLSKGDTSLINLKVLMVWVYEKGRWQLLARQAVK